MKASEVFIDVSITNVLSKQHPCSGCDISTSEVRKRIMTLLSMQMTLSHATQLKIADVVASRGVWTFISSPEVVSFAWSLYVTSLWPFPFVFSYQGTLHDYCHPNKNNSLYLMNVYSMPGIAVQILLLFSVNNYQILFCFFLLTILSALRRTERSIFIHSWDKIRGVEKDFLTLPHLCGGDSQNK